MTGTSDQLPVEAQLAMIREILPDAETIGILYTTSEANSAYSITQYEKYAEEYALLWKQRALPILQKFPWQRQAFWIR